VSLVLALATAALFGTGTWLLLQRRLSRIIIGIGLLGHGANLLLVMSGRRRGTAPVIGTDDPANFADPLPQALALTAIVITFGVTAFLLALGYRSWQLTRDDEVADDVEDRLVARLQAETAHVDVEDVDDLPVRSAPGADGDTGAPA
jgi:multicomponent Na+:H+ antiporter subunit C